MKTKTLLVFFLSFLLFFPLISQDETNAKTGWTFGAVPVVGGDSDVGFQYGALANFYYYGDGSRYPKYDHSLYLEWSHTTKGKDIKQFSFDSDRLIPGLRTSGEISYLTDNALDFYGFNGYESYYNRNFTDQESVDYKSRLFYKMDRRMFVTNLEFQGDIIENKLTWFGGATYYHHVIDTIDRPDLNEGKDTEDMLPFVNGGLYGDYVRWGLIPGANGETRITGNTTLLKAGLVYDTRDNEANAMKGIWTELQLIAAPGFLGSKEYAYTRMVLTHRQYFTLIPKTVNFAYRLSYQSKLTGTMPFYMLPFVFNTAPDKTRDGLGGGTNLRGVLRNRVVGEDILYGNMELRWKILRTQVLNQNFYIALAGFLDGGLVTGKYELPETTDPEALAWMDMGDKETIHLSYGAGVHFALNENFIVSVDYGLANDIRDGKSGFYVGLNFLY